MAKSVVTGMAVCAALAVCAGNANAHAHKSHVHMTRTALTLSSLTAKGGSLHDCVHVTFLQCGGGVDGSKKWPVNHLFGFHYERRQSCGN